METKFVVFLLSVVCFGLFYVCVYLSKSWFPSNARNVLDATYATNAADATTDSILASWPLRQLRSLRLLRALRWMETLAWNGFLVVPGNHQRDIWLRRGLNSSTSYI